MPSTLRDFSVFAGGRYTARLLSGEESERPGLTYPGLVENGWVDGPGVEITPAGGDPWVARFAGADVSPNALTIGLYHPCPYKLCIIAHGAGYEVNVERPSDWRELPLVPIMGCLALEEQRALVLWDYSRFIAVFEGGVRWCSPAVTWDGIGNVQYEDGMITADVWDAPSGRSVQAMVQLEDGRVIKGASPELVSR
jgi:hypothetical protein